jgi:geranylgeranyl diphosphate synthase type I
MSFEAIKQRILARLEVAGWPQMVQLIERTVDHPSRSIWRHSVLACQAVGGTAEAAVPGAAAILCSLLSIHLVDDMLDDDPRGDYRHLGTGTAANLALAFQAVAHRLLEDAAPDPATCTALQATLARMSLATAFGQSLDAVEARNEEEYWRAVEAKTPPLFSAALSIGAQLGGAPASTVAQLEAFGGWLGKFIQVSDDLVDALQTPAQADWRRRSNNLAILYASTAEHAEREEFTQLAARAEDPSALAAAQQILLRSGAVSYCTFKLMEFSRQARDLLARIPLPDPEPLRRLLDQQLRPLDQLFASTPFAIPDEISLD